MNDVKELERPVARHDEPQDKPSSPKKPPRRGKGVAVRRYYTVPGIHPFEKIEWERRVARLTDVSGKVIFEVDPKARGAQEYMQLAKEMLANENA